MGPLAVAATLPMNATYTIADHMLLQMLGWRSHMRHHSCKKLGREQLTATPVAVQTGRLQLGLAAAAGLLLVLLLLLLPLLLLTHPAAATCLQHSLHEAQMQC
jgi:hypothetical protein